MANLAFFVPIIALVLLLVAASARILREYERGVVFTLGRFTGVKGPGLILLIPYVQQMVRVDQRTMVLDVPSQDVISHDNVSVKVNAVMYFPGRGPRALGDPGRQLRPGHQRAGTDHATLGARQA